MPYRANYPATVAEVLVDGKKYKDDTLRALKAFRRIKPWRGSDEEKRVKFVNLNAALAGIYDIAEPKLVFVPSSGSSYYCPHSNELVMVGKWSVVTFLHEFGHARGFDERRTCRWSINLFRRIFPKSFARCEQVGHMLLKPS